jgi:SAM-dependent methyltransferase
VEDDPGAFTSATGRTLESGGSDQPRYRRYQFDLISPHCGESVLEVGAGLGEFAEQFRSLKRHVVTDVDPGAVEVMRRRFADRPEVTARQFDVGQPLRLDEPVESVVAINVLEHIDDDAGALRSLAKLVKPGGTIVLWVPGYQQLYGEFFAVWKLWNLFVHERGDAAASAPGRGSPARCGSGRSCSWACGSSPRRRACWTRVRCPSRGWWSRPLSS